MKLIKQNKKFMDRINFDDPFMKYQLRKEYIRDWVKQDYAFNNERYRCDSRKYYERHRNEILLKHHQRYLTNKETDLKNKREKHRLRKDSPDYEEWRQARNKRERDRYTKYMQDPENRKKHSERCNKSKYYCLDNNAIEKNVCDGATHTSAVATAE